MTLTDETLVRDLAERADLTAPPMSLDPAMVLSAGRRHRHRLVGARVALVAGVGIVAIAVAAGTLNPPDATPPAAVTAQLAEGLIATAANAADIVSTRDGDALALTDGAGHRYTVRFDVAAGTVLAFKGAIVGTEGGGGWFAGFGAGAEGADEGEGISQAGGLVGDAILVAGYVSGPGGVRLEWSGDGPTRALDVPTFAVPGAAGRVYIVRIEGIAPDGGRPTVTVVHSGETEHRVGVDLAPLMKLADAADGPTVTVAAGGTEVDSSAGPVLDLAIPLEATLDHLGTDETWTVRYGTLVDGSSATPDAPGLWLGALAPDGTFTMGSGGSVDASIGPDDRSPVQSAMLSEHDAVVLGVRTPALEDATFTFIVDRDGGEDRVAIPTFRVPGFDRDVWFVALTDPEVALQDWPDMLIEVTTPDGSTTQFGLDGVELREAKP